MTKEELLKIYSAYLPYGLELQHKYKKAKHSGETVLRSWVKPLEHLDLGCLFPHRKDSFDWKPILYDLSYLTQEIEHEGRKFIPMHILKNGGTDLNEYRFLEWKGYSAIDNEQHETCYCPETMSFYQFYMGDSRMCTGQYEKMQMLLKWHFNVFNLPEDQFINKATLKTK